jgi:hypothetical protein
LGGILCLEWANVTLAAIGAGHLETNGGENPGLGAPASSSCERLAIVNGSIRSQGDGGSAGIGTGVVSSINPNPARIETMTIESANVIGISGENTAADGGAGSGTGSGSTNGKSTIGCVTIKNANATGSSSGIWGGSGIRTAYVATKPGDTSIGRMTIEDSNVTGTVSGPTSNYPGSGIGTGSTRSSNGGNIAIGLVVLSGALRIVCTALLAPSISVANAWIYRV